MIVLFTDFGSAGPYIGQMKAVILQCAPNTPIVDLMHDAPMFNPKANAYLLNALRKQFPHHCVFVAVVDPGVGSEQRQPVIIKADDQWFVGPNNGLFDLIAKTSDEVRSWQIHWRPRSLCASFHGRDVFAPLAARLIKGDQVTEFAQPIDTKFHNDWPSQLAEIVYIDHFGNAMTGLSETALQEHDRIKVAQRILSYARVFADQPLQQGFWYRNSIGLIELAANQASLAAQLGLQVGTELDVLKT